MARRHSFEGYVFRFTSPEDFKAIMDFYGDSERRTVAVYLRHEDIIRDQAESGRYATVWKNGQLIAASALYPLADQCRINCAVSAGGGVERGSVLELGSVLRWKEELDENGRAPVGFWHPLLFGVPMIEAFRMAGRDLTLDLLVCDVQTDRVQNIRRLTGVNGTNSPLRWELIAPASQLTEAFGATTSDPNVQREKQFFRAPIRTLPAIAEYLLDCCNKGYLLNARSGETLGIDLSALPVDAMRAIVANKKFFKRLPMDLSWQEARRLFDPISSGFSNLPNRLRARRKKKTNGKGFGLLKGRQP